jgi:hypothetical protein
MNRLYVAGDSFASLVEDQKIGNSWSEILADMFNLELVNIARPGASNFSIALQVDWIAQNVDNTDFTIVFLTDHSRKTIVDLDVPKENKSHPVEYHSKYKTQRPVSHLNLSEVPRLKPLTFFNSKGKDKNYFRDWFDLEMQQVEDRLVLIGALSLLNQRTNKFIACKGGYGKEFSLSPYAVPYPSSTSRPKRDSYTDDITNSTLCLSPNQFVELTGDMMLGWSERTDYINHLDDMTHKKVASYLRKYIRI